jgi:hypothetical protein
MKLIKLNKMGLRVPCVVCIQDHLCKNTAVQSGTKDVLALLFLISFQNMSLGRKRNKLKFLYANDANLFDDNITNKKKGR